MTAALTLVGVGFFVFVMAHVAVLVSAVKLRGARKGNDMEREDVKLAIERMVASGAPADGLTAWAAEEVLNEIRRLRAALETITRSHPSLVMRGGGPAAWLVAKAALLHMPLRTGGSIEQDADTAAVVAEWAKTEPAVRR